MEKLLVAYDGSEQAAEAARAAARLANALGAAATIVTAGQSVTPLGTAVVPTIDADAFKSIVQAGVEIMRGLGVDPAVHIEFGSAAEVILELARREPYGAVVLGHHSRGRIGEAMLGSVAKAVAATAPCPVLIVPSTAPERIERILVAVGDPEHAERVMDPAVLIARAFGGAITLLQVIDTVPLTMAKHSETMMQRKDVMTGEGLTSLVAAATVCQQAGIPCDALQPSGQPADVIQAVTAERDYDLIVMGRRDRGLLDRVVLGSVSDEVLRRTTRPVLVVR